MGAPDSPAFNVIVESPMLTSVEFTELVVPLTVRSPSTVTALKVTSSVVPTACPIDTDAVEPSPGVCVIDTPVPAATLLM